MSTQFYEKVFLVDNIPQIEGIQQVRDMIKSFVYTGDWYMNKAKEFSERFKKVNRSIRRAYSRNNPISIYYTTHPVDTNGLQEWKFGFNSCNDDRVEHIQINSANCYICGEYIEGYSLVTTNLPYCTCLHNQEDDEEEIPDEPIYNWTEAEYQQYWNDYYYNYDLSINTYNDDEYYNLNGYENLTITPIYDNLINF